MFADEAQGGFVGEGHGDLGWQTVTDVQDTTHSLIDQELEVRDALVTGAPKTENQGHLILCLLKVYDNWLLHSVINILHKSTKLMHVYTCLVLLKEMYFTFSKLSEIVQFWIVIVWKN